MNNFQRVLKNTFFLTFSEFFLRAIGFSWVIFLAHSLPVDLYGRYNFVNSFIAIFSFLPDLGIGIVVIREIAKNKKQAADYLGTSFILNGFLAFITFVLMFFVAFVFNYPPETKILISIASLTLLISTIRSVAIFFFDGVEKMHYSATFNTLNTVIMMVGGAIGYLILSNLLGVFVGMLIGTVISTILNWGILLKKFITPVISINIHLIKHLFSEGLPLGLAAFASLIYTRIDSIMLGQMLDERSVGIYNSATPFVFSFIQLLNVPFVVAVYPVLSRLVQERKRFNRAIYKSLFVIVAWSFPVSIFIAFFAPFIIPFVFGAKYKEAIPVLQIIIFSVPFASLSAFLYKVLIVLKKQYVYLYVSILGAVVNIVSNIFMIPKFYILGASFSLVLTQIFLLVNYAFWVKSYLSKLK